MPRLHPLSFRGGEVPRSTGEWRIHRSDAHGCAAPLTAHLICPDTRTCPTYSSCISHSFVPLTRSLPRRHRGAWSGQFPVSSSALSRWPHQAETHIMSSPILFPLVSFSSALHPYTSLNIHQQFACVLHSFFRLSRCGFVRQRDRMVWMGSLSGGIGLFAFRVLARRGRVNAPIGSARLPPINTLCASLDRTTQLPLRSSPPPAWRH